MDVLFVPLFAAGCTVHTPELEPAPLIEASSRFSEGDVAPTAGAAAASRPVVPWWVSLGDAALARLIDDALAANLELRQLTARLDEASALARAAGAGPWPTLDVAAEYSADWSDNGAKFRTHDESAAVGLVASWEIDVWGRLRAVAGAADVEREAALDDWHGGRLLLSAAVAETYYEVLEQRLQLRLVEQQVATNTTLLELTRLRFGQGQSSIVDVLQQREQLASTNALIPGLERRLETLEYLLDVLLGRAPGERPRLETRELTVPPPLPDLGLPADLLTKRPDVRAARSRLVAADYRIGAAIAARLPRFTVGGSLAETGTPRLETLVGSLIGEAVAPLFDAGRRRAEVDFQIAQVEGALADFSHTYLVAVQEVETAILQERKQAERVGRLEEQLAIARQLLNETRNRYSQGLTDYLPVLAAVATLQDLERDLITSRREQLSFRVALHRALGGSTVAGES